MALPSLLKKGRSKGARVGIAFQSISGLRDPKLFGQQVTDDILGQISNRFCGRVECHETAEFLSRLMGDAEFRQVSESRSQSKQRLTTSKNWQPAIRRAMLPSEFMSIAPCGFKNGLTGLFTTRSDLPTWDVLPARLLFNQLLIPAADDVPEFIPRDPYSQFVQPWTPELESIFAPRQELRKDNTISPDGQSLDPENDLDSFDL